MAIYKYTLIKYAKSWSTWVILAASIIIIILFGGFVPFKHAPVKDAQDYALFTIILVSTITTFLSIFTSVFSGFKSATMFKDEVEDGSFLVLISKPVSRAKIILYKWLALQTTIFIYTFLSAITFLIAIVLFDNGSKLELELNSIGAQTIKSKAVGVSLTIWAVLFIISLIFSSISLLLSTKLSVGTTIGMSVSIGVVIPVTTLIGTFTSRHEYKSIMNVNFKVVEKTISEYVKEIKEDLPEKFKPLADSFELDKLPSIADDSKTLYGLGVQTGNVDNFDVAQIFDLNYQIKKLSELASEQITPEPVRGNLDSSNKIISTVIQSGIREAKDNPFVVETKFLDKKLDELDELIVSSWKRTQKWREKVFDMFFAAVRFIKFDQTLDLSKGAWFFEKEKYLNRDPKVVKIIHDDKASLDKFIEFATSNDQLSPKVQIHKSFDQVEAEGGYEDYMIANLGMFHVLSDFYNARNKMNFENEKYDYAFKSIIGFARHLFRPLDAFVNNDKIRSFISDNKLRHIDAIKERVDKKTHNLGQTGATLVLRSDAHSYDAIASAISQGYDLARIENHEYSSKYTILWIYIVIALILVPLSYLIIRRQDFR